MVVSTFFLWALDFQLVKVELTHVRGTKFGTGDSTGSPFAKKKDEVYGIRAYSMSFFNLPSTMKLAQTLVRLEPGLLCLAEELARPVAVAPVLQQGSQLRVFSTTPTTLSYDLSKHFRQQFLQNLFRAGWIAQIGIHVLHHLVDRPLVIHRKSCIPIHAK